MLRQCSWSSCDSGCTGSEESRTAGSQVIQQRRSGLPGVINSSSSGSCSGTLIEEREEIPWHPGTVKRTKKRIEQRSSNVPANVAMKWNATSTTYSALPSATSSVSTETSAHGDDFVASSTAQQHSQKEQQEEDYPTVRERPGMVSSNYARLSASAPDSYNLYAEPGSRVEAVGSTNPVPAKRQVKLHHQHSFVGAADDSLTRNLGESSTSYCLRVSFRGGTGSGVDRQQLPNQQQHEPGDGVEEDTFNAGKVRNLKMSFEAKSNDRRQGPKKVRSLPSSPVAVHVSMGCQTKRPLASSTTAATTVAPSSPSSASPLAGLVTGPSAGKNVHQSTTPPEDVTVRDLVDRYEVQGPRVRPVGSHSLSRTQRPRSVFEPLKQSGSAGKPFAQTTTNNLLSHSTTQWRLDDSMRPPVPPVVRGLVPSQHGGSAPPYNNNSSSTNTNVSNQHAQSGRISSGSGIGSNSNSNARNNNNPTRLMLQQSGGTVEAGVVTQVGGKRTQQHGRTHPLAKISPSARHHHHHLHVHHHLVHHHHQYNIGQLQQHRHIGSAPGPGVSGTTGPSATVTANAYNTM